jgi:hypothetical protein
MPEHVACRNSYGFLAVVRGIRVYTSLALVRDDHEIKGTHEQHIPVKLNHLLIGQLRHPLLVYDLSVVVYNLQHMVFCRVKLIEHDLFCLTFLK